MSKNLRIIPRLDIKGPNLVKGVHLEGLRVLGQPADFAKFYYENGADELIYIDSVASLYGRNNLTDILKFTAKNVFIPTIPLDSCYFRSPTIDVFFCWIKI